MPHSEPFATLLDTMEFVRLVCAPVFLITSVVLVLLVSLVVSVEVVRLASLVTSVYVDCMVELLQLLALSVEGVHQRFRRARRNLLLDTEYKTKLRQLFRLNSR